MSHGRLAMLAAAVLGVASDLAAKLPDCPDGEYQVEAVGERARLENGQPIDLLLGTVALPTVCPAAEAVPSPYAAPGRWFGRVQARWDACSAPIRGIRARFDPTCTALDGVLRLGRGRKVRFHSTRVAECGDGILQASEECDAPGDPCCTADCHVVPGCSGPCQVDDDCAAVAYCDWGYGCEATQGECRLRSVAPCVSGNFCGCDGVTYSDSCTASAARVPLEYSGACGSHCILGDDRLVCAADSFCDIPGWQCDQKGAGTWGNCVAVPDDPASCVPYLPIPICGCDGVVYQNDCYRLAARVQWQACDQ